MAPSKIRIGLIGYGNWGKRIYETLCSFPDVDVSIIEKNAFASQCDAVIIATPSSTHAELALGYLEKNIPTFVEKPLATSTRDVERIIDYVKANNSLLFVGYIYLYNNFLDIIRDHLYKIGPINLIEFIGYNQKPRIDSSLFWDWLPHDLTICEKIFNFFPSITTVKSYKSNSQVYEAEVNYLNNNYEIVSRLSSRREVKRTITFKGEHGQIKFDDRQKFLNIESGNDKIIFDASFYVPPLKIELREFVVSVQNPDKKVYLNVHRCLERSLIISQLIEYAESFMDDNEPAPSK